MMMSRIPDVRLFTVFAQKINTNPERMQNIVELALGNKKMNLFRIWCCVHACLLPARCWHDCIRYTFIIVETKLMVRSAQQKQASSTGLHLLLFVTNCDLLSDDPSS